MAGEGDQTVELSAADLKMLVICAMSYNSRLPHGVVPERIMKLLPPAYQLEVREEAQRDR